MFALFALPSRALDDGDVSWHLAAGRWITQHGAVPAVDPFSYTFSGQPWMAHEWLAELFMYAAFSLGGWGGLLVLFGVIAGIVVFALTRSLGERLGYPAALIPIAYAAAACAPLAYARPHVMGWALLIWWTISLISAREQDRAPPLWLAGAMVVWANLHGSFFLGLALIGPLAAEALLAAPADKRFAVIRSWGLFAFAALVAALVTPHGVHGLTFPFEVSRMETLGLIEEWGPPTGPAIGLALAPLAMALLPGVRVGPMRLLTIAALTLMALTHARHLAMLAFIAAPLLAGPVGERLGVARQKASFSWRPAFVALIATGLVAGFGLWRNASPPDSSNVPRSAIAALPPELRTQRVFNDYSFGGPLIEAGIPVFIDGRADIYGDRQIWAYARIAAGDAAAFEAARGQWHFTWTILRPDSSLISWLDTQPGWKRVYADRFAVVHQRTGR